MTIYKVIMRAYDAYKTMDRDGFVTIEIYFTDMKRAEQWIQNHKDWVYRSIKHDHVMTKEYQRGTFKIETIETEELIIE